MRSCHTGNTWTEVRTLLERSHPAREIDACIALAEKDRSDG